MNHPITVSLHTTEARLNALRQRIRQLDQLIAHLESEGGAIADAVDAKQYQRLEDTLRVEDEGLDEECIHALSEARRLLDSIRADFRDVRTRIEMCRVILKNHLDRFYKG